VTVKYKYVAEGDTNATDSGTFSALVASFNTVDRGGDLIKPGSFLRSLERWRKSKRRIPVIWSHGSHDPSKVVGSVAPSDAWETSEGLVVHGRLDLNSATAREVLRLLKSGDVDGWSFGYRVPKNGQKRRNGVNEISEVDLLELGPTPIPMNAEARTLVAKAAGDPDNAWKSSPRYPFGDEVLTYDEIVEHATESGRSERVWREIKEASAQIEAEEKAAEQAAATAPTEVISRTDAPFTDDEGRHPAVCAEPSCKSMATNPNGSLRLVPDRRWWCDAHRDQAGEHDHLPPEPTYILAPGGFGLRLNPRSEKGKRVRREDEERRKEARQRREAEERERLALSKVRRKFEEETTISIAGARVHPANITMNGGK
jgi:uncharacterized protein